MDTNDGTFISSYQVISEHGDVTEDVIESCIVSTQIEMYVKNIKTFTQNLIYFKRLNQTQCITRNIIMHSF